MEDLFQVGVITAPHGVRGEVKVFPTTDDNARFKNLKTVLLDQGRGTRELEIEGVKFFKNMVILKFKGIDDRNDVERMRQAKLLVTRENAVELGKDEYFIADLIGIQVVSDEGEELGHQGDVGGKEHQDRHQEDGTLSLFGDEDAQDDAHGAEAELEPGHVPNRHPPDKILTCLQQFFHDSHLPFPLSIPEKRGKVKEKARLFAQILGRGPCAPFTKIFKDVGASFAEKLFLG